MPPQGPFKRPLGQSVIGQMPPVISRMHSPQAEQRSKKLPCASITPIHMVLQPGMTVCSRRSFSLMDWAPKPQAKDNITSASSKAFLFLANSIFTWGAMQGALGMTKPTTLLPFFSNASFNCITSFSPTVLQLVEHSPQPTKNILVYSFKLSNSFSRGF